jgi:cell division protein ZapA
VSDRVPGRQSVTVIIAGERHVIRAEAPPEYTRQVAEHVDATIRNLDAGHSLEPHRAAILAALTITDELFRARQELDRLQREIARRSTRLANILERAAEGAPLPGGGDRPER